LTVTNGDLPTGSSPSLFQTALDLFPVLDLLEVVSNPCYYVTIMQSSAPNEHRTQCSVEPRVGVNERLNTAHSPFVVGVTGHRHLDEVDAARGRNGIADFLHSIKGLLPDTELKLTLGMATDADLLVADTALELGICVQAMLPTPLAELAADFDDRNRRLLTRLLAHTNLHCVELPNPEKSKGSLANGRQERRDAAYRNLTEVLIRKSNLLLALWDGKVSQSGSAADAVLRCLGIRVEESGQAPGLEFAAGEPGTNTDSCFVYWLPIASGGDAASVAPNPPCYLTGLGDTILKFGSEPPAALRRRLEGLNDYNRDFQRATANARSEPGEFLLAGMPDDLLEERLRLIQIDSEFGHADTLALHYQKRSDGLFGMFSVFAFFLGCLYLIYDKLGENQGFLLAYLLILLGSLVLYRLLYTRVWFVKHLSYRVLAETLRVKFYLSLAGIDRSVDAAELLALSGIEHFEGFGWIGYVLRNLDPIGVVPAPLLDERRGTLVRKAWVDNQFAYFSHKVKRLEQTNRRVSRWQIAVIAFTVIVLVARMVFAQSMHNMYVMTDVPLKNVLMLGAEILALFLGAWKLHQSQMATRELIWQYKNQLAHFSRANTEFLRTATPSRRCELLLDLGRRSLMESYLWTIHRYHREHAPPVGG